jgi:hypothetical protein
VKGAARVAAELCPSPGKVAAHTEFTRDGKYALVRVWDTDAGKLSGKPAYFNELTKRWII